MSRPTSRLHLEFDPLTKVCRCGCGLTLRQARIREAEIEHLDDPERYIYSANGLALKSTELVAHFLCLPVLQQQGMDVEEVVKAGLKRLGKLKFADIVRDYVEEQETGKG